MLPPISVDGIVLAAVADGVGGHADGQFASETAIKAVLTSFERTPRKELSSAFQYAREQLIDAANQFPLSRSMATTLSVVRVEGYKVDVGHVGDSRVYHLRGSGLVSRTVDQTEVAELVRQNVFSPEEALRYPRRNVLVSSLSIESGFDFYGESFETSAGDGLVLCSDGLYNCIKKAELISQFCSTSSAQEFVENVKRMASDRGVRDDATLVALRL